MQLAQQHCSSHGICLHFVSCFQIYHTNIQAISTRILEYTALLCAAYHAHALYQHGMRRLQCDCAVCKLEYQAATLFLCDQRPELNRKARCVSYQRTDSVSQQAFCSTGMCWQSTLHIHCNLSRHFHHVSASKRAKSASANDRYCDPT